MEPLIVAYDYLYYIFNAQGSSYKAPLRVRVTLLKKSVEITEMYSTLMNKLFILNKMWITSFLIDELVALFHLFLFQKRSPAFVPC